MSRRNSQEPPKPLADMTYAELMAWRAVKATLPPARLPRRTVPVRAVGSFLVTATICVAKVVIAVVTLILLALGASWWVGVAEGAPEGERLGLSHSQWDVQHRG
jgi:hypothetical protein